MQVSLRAWHNLKAMLAQVRPCEADSCHTEGRTLPGPNALDMFNLVRRLTTNGPRALAGPSYAHSFELEFLATR